MTTSPFLMAENILVMRSRGKGGSLLKSSASDFTFTDWKVEFEFEFEPEPEPELELELEPLLVFLLFVEDMV